MRKLTAFLENFFAGLRVSELAPEGIARETFPDSADAAVACRIGKNKFGGYSIFIGDSVRIGNYATRADARRVAEKWNFFVVEKQL